MKKKHRAVVNVVPSTTPDVHYVYFNDGTVIRYDAGSGTVMWRGRIPEDLEAAVAEFEAQQRAEEQATIERTSAAYGVLE
jgi:phage baseplate assembly protein gpV